MTDSPASGSLNILLVDDHRAILWGLERLIQSEAPLMRVAAAVTTVPAALEVLRTQSVDVILLDLDLGEMSGVDAIGQFAGVNPARVLVLTGSRDVALHDRAVLAGAFGVVSKEDPAETILKAIRKAAAGELWLDRSATGRIFIELSRRKVAPAPDPNRTKLESLTPRERQIVAELASDASATTRAVATKMCISEHTLRNHLSAIYEKLGVASRLELWAFAGKHGLGPVSTASKTRI